MGLNFLYLVAVAVLVVLTAYVATRAASIAYFRTKLEHFRTIKRESGE